VDHRPTVSVIVPFAGSEAELDSLVARLVGLERRPGDELIVADNRPGAQLLELVGEVRLHPASAVASAGFARNRGAAVASGEWLVFIDADTEPEPGLLAAYFKPVPGPDTAVLAGGILDVAEAGHPASLIARHTVARAQMSQSVTLGRALHPYAQSANIAVRRDALVRAGGFEEHARAAEDADLCFRLQARGLGIESRPAAVVRHRARQTLPAALTQLARHGAGARWCNRRHPGSFPRTGVGQIMRRAVHSLLVALGAMIRGDREQAGFAVLEIAETLAFELGRVIPNQPRWRLRR
jgi:GT2 family glycosyltransferase